MRGKKMDGFPTREKALEDFFRAWEAPERTEYVPLAEAAGRVTAEDLFSKNTLPLFRTSGCDGIAVQSARFTDGMPDYTVWTEGKEFVRADTGDDFPDEYDAVIMIEEVDFAPDGRIRYISDDLKVAPGMNVSAAGHTVQEGELLIGKDLPLRPTDLAALAMGGYAMVPVRQRPKIAFIPTGSELIPCSVRPERGQNVDTNSFLVAAALREMGAEPVLFPIVKDAPASLRETLDAALAMCDCVVINGGSAKGGEDFNYRLLTEKGQLIHHYIAAAPGRPLAMAVISGKPVIDLPGPAMAAFFGSEWCLRAVVCRYLHLPVPKRQTVRGELTADIKSSPQMAFLVRMHAEKRPDGTVTLTPLSFKTMTLPRVLTSNAMFVSDVGDGGHKKGEILEAELLRGEEYLNVQS